MAQTPNVALTGTAVGGSSSLTGLGAVSATASDTFDFYVIDGTRAFGAKSDATQTGLIYLEFQN